jgi:hypothetical protein
MPTVSTRFGLLTTALLAAVALAARPAPSGAPQQKSAGITSPISGGAQSSQNEPKRTSDGAVDGLGRIDGYLGGGRWREGSKLVDVVGRFQVTGDRAAFQPADSKSRFLCLENLNCERVARIVGESPEPLDWIVQGTITEYRGENYVLINQAVIRTRASRPARPADE